jgi:hypothetical protein
MLPKTHPISSAEEAKGPSTSTDTRNRGAFFGTYRNIVVMVSLLGLVTNSLVSNNYSRMLTFVPDSSSQQNQMSRIVMATVMEQPYDTEIIANETVPKKAVETLASCNETTVIITSNFIPISPSLAMIDKTIKSLHHLRGLCPTSPLIITVDGINKKLRSKHNNTDERLAQYVQALKETYNQDHHTILARNRSIYLTNQVQNAMRRVKTEFVYIIQHDMPFVQDINHAAILKSMDKYPDVLRLVRFNLRRNVRRDIEGVTTCYNETTPVDAINGINLIKTWIWSDNNHLTRKSYYEEMFKLFQEKLGQNPRFMEWYMRGAGEKNCSYWGTFYYGRHGLPPTIGHFDGQRKTSFARRR